MIDTSRLANIKTQMAETKKLQEESLRNLLAIKSTADESTDATTLKELNKAIKAVESSLKNYKDI